MGATTGWSVFGGTATLVLENGGTTPGLSNSGSFAVAATGRNANFQGPGYALPTGPGQYAISVWAMQNDNPTLTAAVQIALSCGTTATSHFPTVGMFGFTLAQGVWTQVTGTVDTSTTADCVPTAAVPGVVRSAMLYLNQTATGTPTAQPNLFLDDLVVQVTDGHNLVGNPNFEASVPTDAGAVTPITSGWSNNGGGTLGVSTTVFNSGAASLSLTGRTGSFNGPKYALPIGAAKYSVTFNALHTGAMMHGLVLQPTYTCAGGSAQFPAAIATAANVAGNTWTPLSGTVTFPPVNAAAGCKLTAAAVYVQQQDSGTCGTGAGQIECPDLFVDDVSITLAQ